MSEPDWAAAIETIKPHCFKVATPQGSGSGFLITFRSSTGFCGVATAYHVIEHAHEWHEPIKLGHEATRIMTTVQEGDRLIREDKSKDVAVILFQKGDLAVPTDALPLVPADKYIKPGLAIGWAGYPAVAPERFLFFSGRISCFLEDVGGYLVDGVAINGVSGSPAFASFGQGEVTILGLVSAYIPNRVFGESLPGVSFVAGIYPFYEIIKGIESLEDARDQEANSQVQNNQQSSLPRL